MTLLGVNEGFCKFSLSDFADCNFGSPYNMQGFESAMKSQEYHHFLLSKNKVLSQIVTWCLHELISDLMAYLMTFILNHVTVDTTSAYVAVSKVTELVSGDTSLAASKLLYW